MICQQQQQQQQGEGGSSSSNGSSSSVVAVSDLIPEEVAQQLDLVLVLGGDGTVLWTCHIFGNR
jgi:NAD kinase